MGHGTTGRAGVVLAIQPAIKYVVLWVYHHIPVQLNTVCITHYGNEYEKAMNGLMQAMIMYVTVGYRMTGVYVPPSPHSRNALTF